ncbi:MIF4G domain containing protein [Trichomonas vaginalis G3]|uniref:MIF4G domain containing protein n=1 Tax=Trichomonas vaginalis (strain ATCC PRA-98 / G3) TaxID=412133 RepID=A2EMG0_TRIV3|nr:armadillo (ARM) repeat-containing protein family [Trichomonas vaginalis G3]EAY06116.1 MIF4G domain containing protein [Trichomonas vaginalis G3]KAI5516939.1 armadillo (ARM) repeat-containing protein family [Trichomonas vaginalis G3]|eukprot:XP_001318339.1 MIF4G domain containing protein [Trichomonas vaginalis G3]
MSNYRPTITPPAKKISIEKAGNGKSITIVNKDGISIDQPAAKPALNITKSDKPSEPVKITGPRTTTATTGNKTFTIVKPSQSTKPITITKNAKTLETSKLWLEEYLKNAVDIKKYPIYEQIVQMNNHFYRYRLQSTSKSAKTPPIKRDEIKLIVNKLTMDNYYSQLDQVITSANMSNLQFLTSLAQAVHEASINGYPLTNLFSLFIQTIVEALSGSEFQQKFTDEILRLIKEEFTKEVVDNNEVQYSWYQNNAMFFGCLVMRKVYPIDLLYDIAVDLVKKRQPYHIAALIKLIIPLAGELEKEKPEASKTIFGEIDKVKTDRSFHSRIRFACMDILDIRAAKWNGIEKQYPQINSMQKLIKRQNAANEKYKRPETKVQIKAGENKFANLMDEDEDEEVAFDPDDMIETYVTDEVVIQSWSYEQDTEYLFEKIVALNKKRALKFIECFQDLYANESFDCQIAFDACKSLFPSVISEDYSDLPDATNILGHIYARIAVLDASFIDKFSECFTGYNLNIIYGFLEEMVRMKRVDQLTESRYWSDYQWREKTTSQLEIVNLMIENDKLLEAFPLYDYLARVYEILIPPEEDEEEGQDEEDKFDVLGAIDELLEEIPQDIHESFEFLLGALEICLESRRINKKNAKKTIAKIVPAEGSQSYNSFKEMSLPLIKTFERICFLQNKNDDDVATWFSKLNKIGFPVADFIKTTICDDPKLAHYHSQIEKLFK